MTDSNDSDDSDDSDGSDGSDDSNDSLRGEAPGRRRTRPVLLAARRLERSPSYWYTLRHTEYTDPACTIPYGPIQRLASRLPDRAAAAAAAEAEAHRREAGAVEAAGVGAVEAAEHGGADGGGKGLLGQGDAQHLAGADGSRLAHSRPACLHTCSAISLPPSLSPCPRSFPPHLSLLISPVHLSLPPSLYFPPLVSPHLSSPFSSPSVSPSLRPSVSLA
jgi:hypothetical protein